MQKRYCQPFLLLNPSAKGSEIYVQETFPDGDSKLIPTGMWKDHLQPIEPKPELDETLFESKP